MAEYAASPSCLKLHMWRGCVKHRSFVGQTPNLRKSLREYSHGSCKVGQLSTWKTCGARTSHLRASPCLRQPSSRFSCLGSLVDPDGMIVSDWISFSEQLLLMTSICLTYMAGVIPLQKSNLTPKFVLDDVVIREGSKPSGSARKNDDHVNLDCAWDAVNTKLLNLLDALEQRSTLADQAVEYEQQNAKQPLSLYAVPEIPKLRLVWASFQRLKEEVNNVIGDSENVNTDEWLTTFAEIIQRSCYPVCMVWLLGELGLGNNKSDEALVSSMVEKLKEDDTILQNIRKSGKEELYAELLYFLRFGSLRENSCYDHNFFVLHGDTVLEDLVITVADGIASVYLELISVDGDLSNGMNKLGVNMCNLSTRALQRLRNEVALNQWLYQNLEAVVSMYEDRFDLCTLQLKFIEDPSRKQAKNRSWWNKLTLRESGTVPSAICYTVISQFSMPVKRTKELRALAGWRYYFSLYLELSDITMPLIRAVIDKVSSAISFFLVTLIGRSLGLIYTGIRQSLRWK